MMSPKIHNKINIIKEPRLYLNIQPASENLYYFFRCPIQKGCLITKLIDNSSFYNAGLRKNDILIKFDKYELDKNGDTDTTWSNSKVNFYDLITKYTLGMIIDITYWSVFQQKIIDSKINIINGELYKINYCRYPFENFNYEIFAGMVVMELTLDHIDALDEINYDINTKVQLKLKQDIEQRIRGCLFVSSIFQGSYSSSLDVKPGSIIENVNGDYVYSIDDFRKAVVNKCLIKNGKTMTYMRLFDNFQIVIDLNTTYNDEQMLSNRYNYKISNLYLETMKLL